MKGKYASVILCVALFVSWATFAWAQLVTTNIL